MIVKPIELAKYPFLPEAAVYIKEQQVNIIEFLSSSSGRFVVMDCRDMIIRSLQHGVITPEPIETDDKSILMNTLKYPIMRILLSAVNNQYITTRACSDYAELMNKYLVEDRHEIRSYILSVLDMPTDAMSIAQYVPLSVGLVKSDPKWKLINRTVVKGIVSIDKDEIYYLLRERITKQIRQKIPTPVNKQILEIIKPVCDQILQSWKGSAPSGPVMPGKYPPCIKHIIATINDGENVSHPARFTLATFMHGIGMSEIEIAQLFMYGDCDVSKTQYQLNHITRDNEYVCPGCSTLLTNNVCIHKDKLCEKINHPLNYYRRKKSL